MPRRNLLFIHSSTHDSRRIKSVLNVEEVMCASVLPESLKNCL